MNEEEIKKMISLYMSGLGTNKIAKILGFHRSTIQYNLIKSGIELRKKSPLSFYDVTYFDKYSPDSCYWAGFIYADGNVAKNNSYVNIHLAGVDLEAIEFIAKATKFEGNIEKCKDSSVRIYFNGEWFPNSLKKLYGIIPKKSKKGDMPKNLSENDFRNFLRGFYDGDGSISRPSCPLISFTSNLRDLEYLVVFFHEKLNIVLKQKHKYARIQNRGCYGQAAYAGKNAKKILDWLYEGSNEETRLRRKYERYKEYFKVKEEL